MLASTDRKLDREVQSTLEAAQVTGLLGQHPRIHDRVMELRLDEFLARLGEFMRVRVPGFRAFRGCASRSSSARSSACASTSSCRGC